MELVSNRKVMHTLGTLPEGLDTNLACLICYYAEEIYEPRNSILALSKNSFKGKVFHPYIDQLRHDDWFRLKVAASLLNYPTDEEHGSHLTDFFRLTRLTSDQVQEILMSHLQN